MSEYPGAIDGFRITQNLPGILYDETDETTVYAEDTNNHSSAIVAIETELGTNPSGAAASVAGRLDGIDTTLAGKENSLGFTPENAANKSTSTSLGTSNTLYPSQNAVKTYIDAAIIAAKSELMPVGTIYGNTTTTANPSTYLGFGTWVAYAEGRTVVGKASAGTFNTLGATMGAETHTLTVSEMPVHNHGVNDPGHNHGMYNTYNNGAGNNRSNLAGGSLVSWSAPATGWAYTGISTQNAGSGAAHNNIQPSKVACLWERTA